jgi:hypothetical protein
MAPGDHAIPVEFWQSTPRQTCRETPCDFFDRRSSGSWVSQSGHWQNDIEAATLLIVETGMALLVLHSA